jgi:beta-lactamase regulating signal transducer with metallopeptidase domain
MNLSTVQHTLEVSAATTTAISLVALGVTALWRGRGAAIRHLALTTALTACLLVPATALLPSVMTVRSPFGAAISPALASAPSMAEAAAGPVVHPGSTTRVALGDLIVAVWLAGMLGLLARFARQSMIAARLRARAVPVCRSEWAAAIATVEARLGGGGRLDVRLSSDVDVPLVSGVRRPVIVLPVSAVEWPADDRCLVLLHECAHIVRRDLLSRTAGLVACAVHWYNPLVWLLAARADGEAEQSADDFVLHSGVRPSEYASLLMSFAEQLRWRPRVGPVLMLARRGTLAPRVHAVLAVSAPRPMVSARARAECTALCAILVVAAGCIRFAPPVAAAEPTRRDRVAEAPLTRGTVVVPSPALAVVPGWKDDAIRALRDLRDDPSPQVRASAIEALERLRHD